NSVPVPSGDAMKYDNPGDQAHPGLSRRPRQSGRKPIACSWLSREQLETRRAPGDLARSSLRVLVARVRTMPALLPWPALTRAAALGANRGLSTLSESKPLYLLVRTWR